MSAPVVLAISGSLRSPSFTEKMLDTCIAGMGEVQVRKFHPHKLHVQPCVSCYRCWKKDGGTCVHQDDFGAILDAYKEADYFLWAAPVYFFGFPATVKNVMDRFFVCVQPNQTLGADGHTHHPIRFDRHPKAVLISSCGFPELDNFDLVRLHFRTVAAHMGWAHAGELLVPQAGASNAPRLFDGKLERIRRAGEELATAGKISDETAAAVAAPVMSDQDYRDMATAALTGGFLGKAKAIAIVAKAIGAQAKED